MKKNRPALSVWAETGRSQWTAVVNACAINFEALCIWLAVRHKMLASRTAETIVWRIQFERRAGITFFFEDGSRRIGPIASILRPSSSEDTCDAAARVQRGDRD